MIKYKTPTGKGEAITEEEAVKICEEQAHKEMDLNGTGICNTFRYNGTVKIQTGNSIWLVEGKPEYNYL